MCVTGGGEPEYNVRIDVASATRVATETADPVGIEMQKWTTYAHDYGRIANTPKDYSKMSEEVAKAIQRVLVQNTDPKEALDEAARNYNAGH